MVEAGYQRGDTTTKLHDIVASLERREAAET